MASNSENSISVLNCSAKEIVERVLGKDRRILMFGPPGVGKSTLSGQLAQVLGSQGRACWCLSADPGSPGFGIPGAITLAQWQSGAWQIRAMEALCTLDAGRFRLPLTMAVGRLLHKVPQGVLLLDGPGVVRGVAGHELLPALLEAADIDTVLAMTAADRQPPLMDQLLCLDAEIFIVHASPEAKRPGKRMRARERTRQWDAYLTQGIEYELDPRGFRLYGLPPPIEEPSAWVGRQLALLKENTTLGFAEILQVNAGRFLVRTPVPVSDADSLLVRDVMRSSEGLIETAPPFAAERLEYIPPATVAPTIDQEGGPRVIGRVGPVDVALVNGIFGDPLLHLLVRHQRRSILFDLGESGRLPARTAHHVTDVFISHAHMDHISGLQWLLRSRLGEYPACRLYGPPGLAGHVEGFLQSFLWDRIDDRGAVFEVAELHGDQLLRYRLQAGLKGREELGTCPVDDGVLLKEPGFRVRAITLDHHTPVLAFAHEPVRVLNVRKDRLFARGLEPGPWLTELKRQLLAENRSAVIRLPDGREETAGKLENELILVSPGKNLVYATDFADTADNRERLVKFAHHAHTFFCEATFIEADVEHAKRNGHLTTRACGEIATEAGVSRLVPFHISRRYMKSPGQVFDELREACNRVVVPESMALFDQPEDRAQQRVIKIDLKSS
jgi:ribonuclease Z